jgi:ribosomal protein S27AE
MTAKRKYQTEYIARDLEPLRKEQYIEKKRKCVRCREVFVSWGKANWVCPACKALRGANTYGPGLDDANAQTSGGQSAAVIYHNQGGRY